MALFLTVHDNIAFDLEFFSSSLDKAELNGWNTDESYTTSVKMNNRYRKQTQQLLYHV